MTALDVDIWSDVMCPWCAVGWSAFEKAIALVEGDVEVTVKWMPFELNPDMPPEGKPQAAHLAEVYGRSPEEIETMRAQMAAKAAEAGFPMDYTGPVAPGGEPPEPMMWNTFAAHKLLRWALAWKGPEVQTALKLALFRAHFNARRNVSDPQVLAEIAASVEGLAAENVAEALADETLDLAVRIEEQRGRDGGVQAVPAFIVNSRYMLQGAQEPEAYAKALRQLASMAAAA